MLRLMIVRSSLKLPTHRADSTHRDRGLPRLRFAGSIGLSISLGLALTTVGARLTSHGISEPISDCPCAPKSTNLVFIIDRSGSFQDSISKTGATASLGRGQTYNVEIKGVVEALLNPSIIPRDGSVSVGVVLFDGTASVPLSLTPRIISEVQARALATDIEALRCATLNDQVYPCPSGATSFHAAISEADRIAQLQPADRRLLIMSTDGERTDEDKGNGASAKFLQHAIEARVEAELDVILIGIDKEELNSAEKTVAKVVIPSAADLAPKEPPGAVMRIPSEPDCNAPGATFGDACKSQALKFADFTRTALRSNVKQLNLTISTLADSVPNTAVSAGSPMSLRQAIETANSNCGNATITFDPNLRGKTIQPDSPLPPLAAPDITLCGCCASCSSVLIDQQGCFPAKGGAAACDRVTIDGRGQFSDGILIRSNRDVVRGLLIKKFTRAGIVIQPLAPCDNTGFNRIEFNILENNAQAGVLVLDPAPDLHGAIVHNVGNTILGNTVLDSSDRSTPIDLKKPTGSVQIGGDGPTDNDSCDADEGPNTLLNFPYKLEVTQSGNSVIVTGAVCDPNCAPKACPTPVIGATIEIFAITRFGSANRSADDVTNPQTAADGRVITGVVPLARGTADAKGSFSVTAPADSPTCGYTATVTDRDGNTSELRFPCSGFAKADITPKDVAFSPPDAVPNKDKVSGRFTIENIGCDKLVFNSFSVRRVGDDVDNGRLKKSKGAGYDDSSHFSINAPAVRPGEDIMTIAPGEMQSFTVSFDPAIPRFPGPGKKPRASETLPSAITSELSVSHNGCGQPMSTIKLSANVTKEVHLIDPENPRNPARVTLTRSPDDLDHLFVGFAVFDSDLNVNDVNYEFFKTRDNQCSTAEPVAAEIVDRDLGKAIRNRSPKLVTGQSFTVIQRFSGALDNPEAGCVRVSVSDPNGARDGKPSSVSATGLLVVESLARISVESGGLGRLRDATIVRPTLKLTSSSRGSRAATVHNAAFAHNKITKTASAQPSRAGSRERKNR